MNHKIIKSEAGFSIIELMIALTIFAIGLLATASMQITAIKGNAGAQKRTTINAAAAGVMEEILTWESNDARLQVTNPDVAYPWDFNRTTVGTIDPLVVSGGGIFEAVYFVDRDNPRPSIATVRLVVTSSAGITSWGANTTTLTSLKRTQ